MDGSERGKLNHEPLVETHTERADRSSDAKVCKSLVTDSTKAGKSGKDQATHIIKTLGSSVGSLKAILFDTTSSNTGSENGLRAWLEMLLNHDLMMVLCYLHVWSLVMVMFCLVLCGPMPSLRTGVNTPPHPIALLMYLYYVLVRDWKLLKDGFLLLFGVKYDAPHRPMLTRWKYVFYASI